MHLELLGPLGEALPPLGRHFQHAIDPDHHPQGKEAQKDCSEQGGAALLRGGSGGGRRRGGRRRRRRRRLAGREQLLDVIALGLDVGDKVLALQIRHRPA